MPNPQSLALESRTRASNEFKLEQQGYAQVTLYAGIWEIIPLILDLEGSLNFTIDSTRPHKLIHNDMKPGFRFVFNGFNMFAHAME